ncbi:MAG: choice-of-anchor L domain-containing protein, partial [Bacteroidota bacterium]
MKLPLPCKLKSSLLWVMLAFFGLHLHGQVTVTTGSPYSQYVQALEGAGVSITDITINCDTFATPSPAMGGFNASLTTLGLNSGLVLTSGALANFLPGGAAGTSNNQPGDPDLDGLVGTPFDPFPTNDRCAVTIKFIAQCPTVSFDYVFGSNEYPTFVGQFDDVFGAFITGPGYTPNTNIALLPNNQPVSISNVNAGNNAASFINNPTGASGITYNGHTVVLTATATVTPCVEYTLKLAVADEGDFAFDSGVFIEPLECSGSASNSLIVARNNNNPNSNEVVENCVDGFFTLYNILPDSVPVTVNYTLTGTATNGVDYTIPATVIMPVGADSINVPVTVLTDGILEGAETIQMKVDNLGCFPDSAVMVILDEFEIDAGPDVQLCSGDQATIGLAPDSGVTYVWTPQIGLNGPTNTSQTTVALTTTILQTFNYVVTGTDYNGCVDEDTVIVDFIPLPLADFGMAPEVCVDAPTTITFSQIQLPGAQYIWNFGANSTVVSGAGAGPYVVSWSTPGPKSVSVTVQVGPCVSQTITKTIVINPIPTALFNVSSQQVCANASVVLNYTGTASPTANYLWDSGGGSPANPVGQGPHNVSWSTSGLKTVSLQVEEKGCLSPVFTQTVDVFKVPTSTFSLPSQVCVENSVQVVYTGDAAQNAAYAWNFGAGAQSTGTGVGPYTVSWPTAGPKTVTLQVEENGCISAATSQVINVLPDPEAGIAPVQNQCLGGNSFGFVYTGDNDVDTYFWNFGADALPAQSQAAIPPTVTYQNPGIKTVSLVVIRDGCISDSVFVTFEVVPEPSANFNANNGGICSDDCITYTYTGIP